MPDFPDDRVWQARKKNNITLDRIVHLIYTARTYGVWKQLSGTVAYNTRHTVAGMCAGYSFLTLLGLIYRIPIVRQLMAGDGELAVTMWVLALVVMCGSGIYYAIYRHYSDERIEHIYDVRQKLPERHARIYFYLLVIGYIMGFVSLSLICVLSGLF